MDERINMMNKVEENAEYLQNMELTMKLINQRPGRMIQLASLMNRYAARPQDFGDGETVTLIEIGILVYIANNPGVTNAILCVQFGRTKGAISQLTKKIEGKGYISREPNPADAKSSLFYSTAKGMKLIQKINEKDIIDQTGLFARMLKLCSLEDIQTFYRMVDTYIALLTTKIAENEGDETEDSH